MKAPTYSIRNEALAASAGTGKTFALSNRYLALLAAGEEPTSIVALTFTRKAAGEILARIITRLAKAAASPKNLQALNSELANAALPVFADHTAILSALRQLTQNLPRLHIGTLDSFFMEVLQQFHLEFGLPGHLAVGSYIPPPQEDPVLQELFHPAEAQTDAARELLEDFKRATFGAEHKQTYQIIKNEIGERLDLYDRAADKSFWGNSNRIWPKTGGRLQQQPTPVSRQALQQAFADFVAEECHKSRQPWTKLLANILNALDHNGDFDFKQPSFACELYQAAITGGDLTSVKYGRSDIPLPPSLQSLLPIAFEEIRYTCLGRLLVQTHGLFRLLERYAACRRRQLLMSGELEFRDVTLLLSPRYNLHAFDIRRQLDYRMDMQFRHWLLDEFQDTSLIQWSVLENLLDEVIQDTDASRTLFYVGDTKQAIYEWRAGDPRLFSRILDKYNTPKHTAIHVSPPLTKSWRSAPVILNTVNTVFGGVTDIPSVPGKFNAEWPAVRTQWAEVWENHEAADKNRDLTGYAALYHFPASGNKQSTKTEESTAQAEPPKVSGDEITLNILQDMQDNIPDFARYSVAILTRSNKEGQNILALLREKKIAAVWAGDSPLLDNALIPAILAFCKWLEHPGDRLAEEHIKMSPLGGLLSQDDAPPHHIRLYWQRIISEQGYSGLCAELTARLDLSTAPLEAKRLDALLTLADDFDRQNTKSALGFISFISFQKLQDEQTGSNIQILTMHKAKGLEFDIVVLPFSNTQDGLGTLKPSALLVQEENTNAPIPPVKWILQAPQKEIIATENDSELPSCHADTRTRKALEDLRLLYVAMTRAKRALYMIAPTPPKTSETFRLHDLLQQTLCKATPALDASAPNIPVWTAGGESWWKADSAPPSPPPPAGANGPLLSGVLTVSTTLETPLASRIASHDPVGGHLRDGYCFYQTGIQARELGTAIHQLFESIQWLTPAEIPAFEKVPADLRQLVAAQLKKPVIHQLFEQPSTRTFLKTEQSFEVVLDGRWLSGKIDRLHLEPDEDGRISGARILDFKTDQKTDSERHRAQMEDYRAAVSRLYSLEAAAITCTLVFVRTGEVVDL